MPSQSAEYSSSSSRLVTFWIRYEADKQVAAYTALIPVTACRRLLAYVESRPRTVSSCLLLSRTSSDNATVDTPSQWEQRPPPLVHVGLVASRNTTRQTGLYKAKAQLTGQVREWTRQARRCAGCHCGFARAEHFRKVTPGPNAQYNDRGDPRKQGMIETPAHRPLPK